MSKLEQALQLAERGFHVFPCKVNSKRPVIEDFPNRATRDPGQIERWFRGNEYNIGISTSRFKDHEALVVVDVDNKNGKDGDTQLLSLELEGFELPASLEQTTPSGGRHIIYTAPHACKQGVNVLGNGLDIRSRGGYIIGPGSEIDGKKYQQINGHNFLHTAPNWLITRLGAHKPRVANRAKPLGGINFDRAYARAIEYLKVAPVAIEGQAGDMITYKVAAKLKDFGCTEEQTVDLLADEWNDRCSPPWSEEDLEAKVSHAFRYGREQPGISAPEAIFTTNTESNSDEGVHPVKALNKEYAFIKDGAFILQETTDAKGRFTTLRLSPADMHSWFANKTLAMGDKRTPISRLWMQSESRREYDAVVFSPLKDVPSRFYNLWRGFSVEPVDKANHPSVDMFLEHALENVCGGEEKLYHWLLSYFAHMIQRPFEKPLVALVFRGSKGTGKNALVERVGKLFGRHFMVADDERYLLGNFNSHLESNLFFVLDEAAWAGDKRAEGKLKGLITGGEHIIERKGSEPYAVDNLTRVAIIGNETWLVPASQEERRFAVFNVGGGRRQDNKFFEEMRVGMEQGGYAHLLRFLLDYDFSSVNINIAPATQGLTDQKHASLDTVQEWWFDCLSSNALAGGDWDGELPALIPTNRLRSAFEHWVRGRNIRSRVPGRNGFFKTLKEMAPGLAKGKARSDDPDDATYSYKNPGIEELRLEWCSYIGGDHNWEN